MSKQKSTEDRGTVFYNPVPEVTRQHLCVFVNHADQPRFSGGGRCPSPGVTGRPSCRLATALGKCHLGQIYTWTESIVTNTFYTFQKVIPELNSKATLGFGSVPDTDGQPSQRWP